MIEEAFVEGSSSMILDLFGVEYKVDLVRMVQVNRMTGFPRAVWRCSEEVSSKCNPGAEQCCLRLRHLIMSLK